MEIVDQFVVGDTRAPRRCAVARDLGGALLLVDESVIQSDVSLRGQLVKNELARQGRPPRILAGRELWLFAMELLEQPGDAVGVNDPIHIYGTLFGPFPTMGDTTAAHAQDGQLTVTRGDLLRGLLASEGEPFSLADSHGGRVLHALLPGDTDDVIVDGRGMLLAYPLFPLEGGRSAGGNEALVCQLICEVVHGLQADLREQQQAHPFCQNLLPVLVRDALERELEADGFRIDGDIARRGGLLRRDEVRQLPTKGDLPDFFRAARQALAALAPSGFPDARSRTLFARVATRAASAQTTGMIPQAPQMSTPQLSTPLTRTPGQGRVAEQPYRRHDPGWMNDFLDLPSPTSTARRPPRLTPVAQPRGSGPLTRTDEPGTRSPSSSTGLPNKKPDWMKDFD